MPGAKVNFFDNKPQTQKAAPTTPVIERLDTLQQHIDLIQHVFQTARESILITTYGINQETLTKIGLIKLIKEAVLRAPNIKIYIYFNNKRNNTEHNRNITEQRIINSLGKFSNVRRVEEAITHSKLLAADRTIVAAGSFNWLADCSTQYDVSDNASIVYRGPNCNPLIDKIWDHFNYYRSIQREDDFSVDKFRANPNYQNAIPYEISADSKLQYLPTPMAHQKFIRDGFQSAKKTIIIISPFIHKDNFQQDINETLLSNTAKRGVSITLVCKSDQIKKSKFDKFIEKVNKGLKANHITLKSDDKIHLKTIIVDDKIIAEGSFNVLSAIRNEDHPKQNHEVTFAVTGTEASRFINNFNASQVGQRLFPTPAASNQTNSALPNSNPGNQRRRQRSTRDDVAELGSRQHDHTPNNGRDRVFNGPRAPQDSAARINSNVQSTTGQPLIITSVTGQPIRVFLPAIPPHFTASSRNSNQNKYSHK